MRDIILFAVAIAYMIGGYFVVDKIGEFFEENYEICNYEPEIENTSDKTQQ